MALSRSSSIDIDNVLICKLRVNCRKNLEKAFRKKSVLWSNSMYSYSVLVIHLRSLIGWNWRKRFCPECGIVWCSSPRSKWLMEFEMHVHHGAYSTPREFANLRIVFLLGLHSFGLCESQDQTGHCQLSCRNMTMPIRSEYVMSENQFTL